jgi:hypothetical protein
MRQLLRDSACFFAHGKIPHMDHRVITWSIGLASDLSAWVTIPAADVSYLFRRAPDRLGGSE